MCCWQWVWTYLWGAGAAAGFDFAAGGGCIYTRSAEGGYLKWVFGGLGQWQWGSTSWGLVEG